MSRGPPRLLRLARPFLSLLPPPSTACSSPRPSPPASQRAEPPALPHTSRERLAVARDLTSCTHAERERASRRGRGRARRREARKEGG
eukprot:1345342-Rhodomonas_salina.1